MNQVNYYMDGIAFVSSIGTVSNVSLLSSEPVFEMEGMMGMDGSSAAKEPILSNVLFVGGITTLTLAVSIGLGILLTKKKIKKGFELYED